MQDNFEKEVQRKMEEMQLTPSEPVWDKIEVEIKVEKKRRKGIFWFVLAGLLLAGGGWWGYQFARENKQQASVHTTPAQKKQTSSYPDQKFIKPSVETNDKTSSIMPSRQTSTIIQQKKILEKKQTAKQLPLKTLGKQKDIEVSATVIKVDKKASNKNVATSMPVKEKKSGSQISGEYKIESTKVDEQKQTSVNVNSIDSQTVSKQQEVFVNDSSSKPQVKKEEALPVSIDSSIKKKAAANNKKWKKQVMVSIGRSSYQDYSTVRNPLNFASPSTVIGSNTQLYYPQTTRGGLGFSAGFALLKQLSKKWELSLALQYAHYTTYTNVGDKRSNDTTISYARDRISADGFYTNTGKNDYANRFHILEIPVTVSFQPFLKLPLYLSAGVAYGRLLSTNALTYSYTSNLYYENKDNYLRNMLPVSTAIQFVLRSKKTVSVRVGPSVQYNLLKLRKENTTGKPHLNFAGLKAGINF